MAEQEVETKPPKTDSGDESEDESEVLEESPCGRWQKRREEVEQRDVPGIDNAFLAMDTEEGMEVVWNEVQFSQKKDFRAKQDQIRQVFDNLIQLDHSNIVKFHKYWTDTTSENPRVIFITEYMSSGSLKQFLKKTKKNNKLVQLKSWKKWCTQILSALSYLHSCNPPIIHGNLTCDTIFIQHNGLIKIGSVAPDAIHTHVKTYYDNLNNMHFIAPEYSSSTPVTTAVDVYAFGMCALEMAALETHGNNETGAVTEEAIMKTLNGLEDKLQQNLIQQCLVKDPVQRPTVRNLLFHKVLFEVHQLKLLAAHQIVENSNLSEDIQLPKIDQSAIFAQIPYTEGKEPTLFKYSQVVAVELEKYLEDVKNGIYPLTAFALQKSIPPRARAVTPEVAESVKSETPEPYDMETRLVVSVTCQVRQSEDKKTCHLTLLLRMNDRMNRQLQCDITTADDTPIILADELVYYGFINEMDRDKVAKVINDNMKSVSTNESPSPPPEIA